MNKLGGIGGIMKMMPNSAIKNKDAIANVDEKIFDRIKAIIYSMTKEERENPSIINPSRKRRIAAGCGQTVQDVNKLLKQYEQIKVTMKQFNKKGKKFGKLF
jgi:signal recognition particle subunit SRP54